MELDDCAFPTLANVEIGDDPRVIFDGVRHALWSAPAHAGPAWSAATCSRPTAASSPGRARPSPTSPTTASDPVTGNPANTNALIAMSNAPDIPNERSPP